MATWTVTLPDTANSGDSGHIADHNAIRAAILEVRTTLDGFGLNDVLSAGNEGDPEQFFTLSDLGSNSSTLRGNGLTVAIAGGSTSMLRPGYLRFIASGGGQTTLYPLASTATRTVYLPDADGVLAIAESGDVPVFIQQEEPSVAGPAVWYQTDGSGVIIDIKVQTS